MSDLSERTEKPTGKKKSDLRKKGEVARSPEFVSACVLLCGFYAFFKIAEGIGRKFISAEKFFLGSISGAPENWLLYINEALKIFAFSALPLGLILCVLSLAFSAIPSGYTFRQISLKFENLNFLKNFSRLFSAEKIFETAKTFAKAFILTAILYLEVKKKMPDIILFQSMDAQTMIYSFLDSFKSVIFKVGAAYLLISIADMGYKIFSYNKRIKMTKQEVKEEFKMSEGNPLVKGKIKSLMRQFSKRNKLHEVSGADAVIVNPTHYAVALKYDRRSMRAPVVIAKGVGSLALKIISIAKASGVPVKRNPPLARALYRMCEPGEEINPVFYRAIAQILSIIYREKGKIKAR